MCATADACHGAARQHDFQAQDVIRGDPVFEAARAAGIGGNVAVMLQSAQLAGSGGQYKPLCLGLGLQISGDHAGLNNGHKIVFIYFLDALHADCRKRNAPF